jgi:hypothetical protein
MSSQRKEPGEGEVQKPIVLRPTLKISTYTRDPLEIAKALMGKDAIEDADITKLVRPGHAGGRRPA